MTKIPTVEELRKANHKVRVTHRRFFTENSDLTPLREVRDFLKDENGRVDNEQLNCFLRPNGGETVVEIRTKGDESPLRPLEESYTELIGKAVCSKSEGFDKKYGRAKAIVRALGLKPQPKFKVGDKIWSLTFDGKKFKIKENKVKAVRISSEKTEISEDYSELLFKVKPFYITEKNITVTEDYSFSSKEELLKHLES